MEAGHLIDRYILDNASSAYDWLDSNRLKNLNLDVKGRWSTETNDTLLQYVDEAHKTTVPVCRDCNIAMTNVQSEITVVFYGILRRSWFLNGVVPRKELKSKKSKSTRSLAKTIEAVFTFFTLERALRSDSDAEAGSGSEEGTETPFDVERFSFEDAGRRLSEPVKQKLNGQRQNYPWGRNQTRELLGLNVKSPDAPEKTGHVSSVDEIKKTLIITWDSEPPSTQKLTVTQLKQYVPVHDNNTPLASLSLHMQNLQLARTDAEDSDSAGSSQENSDMPLHWKLQDKKTMWRNFALLKTISHLMQWGAHKAPRHRALAVFWSAYYLWNTFLTEEEQLSMPVRVWYVLVFREYYMYTFPGNYCYSPA